MIFSGKILSVKEESTRPGAQGPTVALAFWGNKAASRSKCDALLSSLSIQMNQPRVIVKACPYTAALA
jgi:hypothetical protein